LNRSSLQSLNSRTLPPGASSVQNNKSERVETRDEAREAKTSIFFLKNHFKKDNTVNPLPFSKLQEL